MTAENYLRQARGIDLHIEERLNEIEHWYTRATKVTTVLTDMRVQSSPTNTMEEAIVEIQMIIDDINAQIKAFREKREEITKTVEMLNDPDLINLIYRRYFDGQRFAEIAEQMGYSETWIYTLHQRALQGVQGVLDAKGL